MKPSPQQALLLTLAAATLVGWGLLMLPFAHGSGYALREGAWLDHLFTATSAISTTGLTTLTVANDYSTLGQVVILLLIQLGGLGYVALAGLMVPFADGGFSEYKAKTLGESAYVPESVSPRTFVSEAWRFILVCEGVGAGLLAWGFHESGKGWGEAAWWGVFHAVSAFCTAGFGLDPGSMVPYAGNALVTWPTMVLAVGGAVGFMFVAGLAARRRRDDGDFDPMSRGVLTTFVILLALFALRFGLGSDVIRESDAPVSNALFLAVTSLTGAGFSTVGTGALSFSILVALLLPMCIGGAPTGTSGGMKLHNVGVALRLIFARVRGGEDATARFGGAEVTRDTATGSAATVTLYVLLLVLGASAAFAIEGERFGFEELMFEVVSAVGTVGLSTGITSDLSTGAKGLLVGLMYVGRVGVLALVSGVAGRRGGGR